MSAARRLYLYLVAAVSLAAMAAGVFNLASVFIDSIVPSGGVIGGDIGQPRSQVSLAIALVVVGLPVWLLHWGLAERGVRRGDARSEDRRSAIRGGYLLFVETVSLAVIVSTGAVLLSDLFDTLLGVTGLDRPVDPLAALTLAVPIWAYHATVIEADSRRTRASDASSRAPRFYRYAASFAVLVIGLIGAASVIGTGLQALIEPPDLLGSSDWWQRDIGWNLALAIVGLGAWTIHWLLVSRGVRRGLVAGEDERTSGLRAAYFGAVTLFSLAMVGMAVAASIAAIGHWILGVGPTEPLRVLEDVAGPPIASVPLVVAGTLHVWSRRREVALVGPAARVAADRLTRYLVALVGLASLTFGAVQTLALGIDVASGRPSLAGGWSPDVDLPPDLAYIILGLVLWMPAWAATISARRRTPVEERQATTSRGYLYLVLGAAVVAGVPTAAYVLYRILDTGLGAASGNLMSDISTPLSIVIVAAIVGAYHGWLVVGDLRSTGERAAAVPAASAVTSAPGAIAGVSGVAVAAPAELTVELLLHGTPDLDVEGVVAALSRALPSGTWIEIERATPSGRPAPA